MIILRGICFDEHSSFMTGARLGPDKIRKALFSRSTNSYSELGVNLNEVDYMDKGDTSPLYSKIESITDHHLELGDKILTMGGDHSITYPIIKSYAKVYPKFDILQFDAHSDLYDNFEGNPLSHACPFARIMEEGLCDRLVQVGIRCLTPHQREQAQKFGVEIIEMKDFNPTTFPEFKNPLYISLDLDGFDPAYAPGVSHHEPGGLTPREVLKIIHGINTPIIGADVVELNPDRDPTNISAALAGKLVKELICKMHA